ncbi:hypothetical protein CVIRNUC_005987 [Coccomyxa viridis]|uniref:Uncharacterized protein n=1 Tax=Coccomyxa viridis TaxID=1274662 RepID=A0AAV1I6W4_9CHLO|nr:hypothetical protein CVIRNUC_005987 [Coccomyxa viridis]
MASFPCGDLHHRLTPCGVGVALADLTFGGSPAGPPILGVGVGAFTFTVRKANALIYSNDSPAAKAGASTTLTVLVNNTDAPPNDLYLDGGTVTVLLGSQSIGTGALSGSGRLLALTSPFTVTITMPAGTASGSQVLTLQYSGTNNFNPSASGQNGLPAGPTLTVISPTGTTVSQTVVPTNPAGNPPMTVSGGIYPSDGSNPVGTVTIIVVPTGGGSPVTLHLPSQWPHLQRDHPCARHSRHLHCDDHI